MTPRGKGRLAVVVAVLATSAGAVAGGPAYAAASGAPGQQGGQANGPNGQTGPTDEPPPTKTPPADTAPKPDTTAPATPVLGQPTVEPGGVVTLSIRAEKGAQILVKDGQQVVAEDTGTGSALPFSWTAKSGSYRYSVTAIDKANNRSEPATVAVEVDAKAPKIRDFKLRAGTASDSRSLAVFSTQPGASYRLLEDGAPVAEGTAQKQPIRTVLDLADGAHRVRVEVTDDVGNRRVANGDLEVKIGALKVSAQLVSEAIDPRQVLTVEAGANIERAELRIPGEPARSISLKAGSGRLAFPLADGTYAGGRVVVEDSQGRTGTAALDKFTVDTTAPTLKVSGDASAGRDGKLEFSTTTDDGALVNWALVDSTGQQVASGRFAGDGQTESVTRDVDAGLYRLRVQATDIYDRTTTRTVSARIAADPWPVWLLPVVAAVGLAVAALALLLLVRLWRHSAGSLRRRRESRALRRGYTPRRLQLEEYKEAERQWRRRYETLSTLLQVADQGLHGLLALMPGVTLQTDEKLLFTTRALLLDTTVDGTTVEAVDQGELVVTNRRLAFAGEQHRDWWCARLEDMRHEGDDVTMFKVSDSDTWSGLSYADPEVTRLYLDLAWAEQHGERDAYVASVSRGLRDLELNRPTRPARR